MLDWIVFFGVVCGDTYPRCEGLRSAAAVEGLVVVVTEGYTLPPLAAATTAAAL